MRSKPLTVAGLYAWAVKNNCEQLPIGVVGYGIDNDLLVSISSDMVTPQKYPWTTETGTQYPAVVLVGEYGRINCIEMDELHTDAIVS